MKEENKEGKEGEGGGGRGIENELVLIFEEEEGRNVLLS